MSSNSSSNANASASPALAVAAPMAVVEQEQKQDDNPFAGMSMHVSRSSEVHKVFRGAGLNKNCWIHANKTLKIRCPQREPLKVQIERAFDWAYQGKTDEERRHRFFQLWETAHELHWMNLKFDAHVSAAPEERKSDLLGKRKAEAQPESAEQPVSKEQKADAPASAAAVPAVEVKEAPAAAPAAAVAAAGALASLAEVSDMDPNLKYLLNKPGYSVEAWRFAVREAGIAQHSGVDRMTKQQIAQLVVSACSSVVGEDAMWSFLEKLHCQFRIFNDKQKRDAAQEVAFKVGRMIPFQGDNLDHKNKPVRPAAPFDRVRFNRSDYTDDRLHDILKQAAFPLPVWRYTMRSASAEILADCKVNRLIGDAIADCTEDIDVDPLGAVDRLNDLWDDLRFNETVFLARQAARAAATKECRKLEMEPAAQAWFVDMLEKQTPIVGANENTYRALRAKADGGDHSTREVIMAWLGALEKHTYASTMTRVVASGMPPRVWCLCGAKHPFECNCEQRGVPICELCFCKFACRCAMTKDNFLGYPESLSVAAAAAGAAASSSSGSAQ